MNLPISNNLPINKLASVFGSTSATYKFYWLIALIELVEEGNIEIVDSLKELSYLKYGRDREEVEAEIMAKYEKQNG